MSDLELISLIEQLRSLPKEDGWLEFKIVNPTTN